MYLTMQYDIWLLSLINNYDMMWTNVSRLVRGVVKRGYVCNTLVEPAYLVKYYWLVNLPQAVLHPVVIP